MDAAKNKPADAGSHGRRWFECGLTVLMLGMLAGQVHAADLTVLTAGAFKQAVLAVTPQYETVSGNHVVVKNDTAGALVKRVERGEHFDVLILPAPAMQAVAASHHVRAPDMPLASVGVGVAVRKGAPMPDISTVAAFKRTVLNAEKIAYIDPAAGGSSGIYVAHLLENLGVADTLKPRTVLVEGGLVGDKVADGSASLAIHQISELLPVQGITVVGPLPAAIQSYTTYVGAVSSGSSTASSASNRQAAQDFLNTLSGPAARKIFAEKGMVSPQ